MQTMLIYGYKLSVHMSVSCTFCCYYWNTPGRVHHSAGVGWMSDVGASVSSNLLSLSKCCPLINW